MYATSHRQFCCGINELKMVNPGDLAKGPLLEYRHKMQYRVHCPNEKRGWMEPELVAAGFTLLATNKIETVWGKVG